MQAAIAAVLCVAGLVASDLEGPTASITFPTRSAMTSASSLRISGVASDASGVAAVSVNGVAAASVDGYRTWSATVPLLPGDNTVQVSAVDFVGNVRAPAAVTVVRRESFLMARPVGLAHDPLAGVVYVCEGYLFASVGAVDVASARGELVSGSGLGAGPELDRPADVALDLASGRLFVTDIGLNALLEVDPASGDRWVISDAATGTGQPFTTPGAVELDLARGRAFVLDSSFGDLFEVDLASGDRTLLASDALGGGPDLTGATGLALLSGSGRALIAHGVLDSLLAVHLASGERAVVSGPSVGLGQPFSNPYAVAAPAGLDQAFVVDRALGQLIAVQLKSGHRRVICSPEPFGGKGDLTGLDLDPGSNRALLTDDGWNALLGIALDSGDAQVLFRAGYGEGPPAGVMFGLIVDPWAPRRVLAVQHAPKNEVHALDLVSGERSLVSAEGVGAGAPFAGAEDLAADIFAASPRLLVVDSSASTLVAVDPATGDRSVLSGPGVGSGPAFEGPHGVALDPVQARNRALVMDTLGGALIAVDLSTGDRSVISSSLVGSGPAFFPAYDVAVEPDGAHAYTAGLFTGAVTRIDLVTGDRVVVSGPALGGGPAFVAPNELVFDAQRDRLLVADVGLQQVVEVDLASGDRTTLVAADPGAGPGPFGMHGLALRSGLPGTGPMVLLGDLELNALLAVDLTPDPVTGVVPAARVIVSR